MIGVVGYGWAKNLLMESSSELRHMDLCYYDEASDLPKRHQTCIPIVSVTIYLRP